MRSSGGLPNLVCLEPIGNRTEKAYATNYQKQPSVAVFFCDSIIKRISVVVHAAPSHFLPVGLFSMSRKMLLGVFCEGIYSIVPRRI